MKQKLSKRIKKAEIFKHVAENFFNMKELSREEEKLFANEKTGLALLMSPFLQLIKADIK